MNNKLFVAAFVVGISIFASFIYAWPINSETSELRPTGYHSGMLELVLNAKNFIAKTSQETEHNINAFMDDIKKMDGLENITIIMINDNNLRGHIIFSRRNLNEIALSKIKEELEQDSLVDDIAFNDSVFSIKLKKRVYYHDEIADFIKRHPSIESLVASDLSAYQNLDVAIKGVPVGKETEFGELLIDKFPLRIKEANTLGFE